MADSVEEVVYGYLTTDTSFMADFNAVYWIEAPDTAAYPYVVFWQVDDTGNKTYLNEADQGEARLQLDLWDDSKARGVRLRTKLRQKIDAMNETRSGYTVTTTGVTEVTVPRDSTAAPYHYVVDGVIQWRA